MKTSRSQGMGLMEVVIGITIVTIGMLTLSTGFNTYIKYGLNNDKNTQAAYLLQEGVEGMYFLRDVSWSTNIYPLGSTTTYYLVWDSTNAYWKATTTPQYIDGIFTRTITLQDVWRDSSGFLASSGTYDPNTRYITVSIAYQQGSSTTTKSISAYVANLYSN